MARLNKLEDKVRPILRTDPETRDNDRELTMKVWSIYYGINPWSPLSEVFRNDAIPTVETIGRVRRKIQETDESLRGSKHKEEVRMSAQVDFIEYALSDTYESRI